MNENQAAEYLNETVSRETLARLHHFARLILAEPHNLISASTRSQLLSRHMVDSLQLLSLSPSGGTWVDVGSGGGLPGIPIALSRAHPTILIEPRRLRAEFLERCVCVLPLAQTAVIQQKAAAVVLAPALVVSARAVATISDVFAMSRGFTDRATTWLLPKGRGAHMEVDQAAKLWHADFEMVPSITEDGSMIVVARNVRPKGSSRR